MTDFIGGNIWTCKKNSEEFLLAKFQIVLFRGERGDTAVSMKTSVCRKVTASLDTASSAASVYLCVP